MSSHKRERSRSIASLKEKRKGKKSWQRLSSKEVFTRVIPLSIVDVKKGQSDRRKGDSANQSSRAHYSHFPEEVAHLCIDLFFRNCHTIFDPFAGWGERHFHIKEKGRKDLTYTGFDLNPKAIEYAKKKYGVKNVLNDSRKAKIPPFDGLFTCPPYWNLEVYGPHGIDRTKSWKAFLEEYGLIWKRCVEAAKPGAMFCVMVADWRNKGVYHDLAFETTRILKDLGLEPWDMVIVDHRKSSLPRTWQANRLGYTGKMHEVLIVMKKPGKK